MNIWLGDPEAYFLGRRSLDPASRIFGVRQMEHADLPNLEQLIHPETYEIFGDVDLERILYSINQVLRTKKKFSTPRVEKIVVTFSILKFSIWLLIPFQFLPRRTLIHFLKIKRVACNRLLSRWKLKLHFGMPVFFFFFIFKNMSFCRCEMN